ncbi:hypothetical protein BMG38_12315 [Salmonella enterica subsp. enterica serovar Enteritidis]|uniref:Uncharacterized protein n=1 Tax=Salmonella montevideo TaxID=115981 RepID=A0A602T6V8_SALMO|nr:hypothetical protein [Salmonella enterica]EAU8724321.1 hypothetical protein [Salmonella enterica subsp. enterica serovar Montevideo]ECE1114330.1 hypothetical protein [Salmonella enterica subsp. enterica]EDD0349260.1 hypothetical protein [Salmonella enterica subsp. enterica serovar Enteritidis]EAA8591810.1 hypothetical protein [Salmonella enterica]
MTRNKKDDSNDYSNNKHDSLDYSEKPKSKHIVTFERDSGRKGESSSSANKTTMPAAPAPGKK